MKQVKSDGSFSKVKKENQGHIQLMDIHIAMKTESL